MGKGGQAVDAVFRHNDDTTPISAIATVGTSPGNIPLASEADTAISTTACDTFDLDSVYEHDIKTRFP
jgi:hypothetical protein